MNVGAPACTWSIGDASAHRSGRSSGSHFMTTGARNIDWVSGGHTPLRSVKS